VSINIEQFTEQLTGHEYNFKSSQTLPDALVSDTRMRKIMRLLNIYLKEVVFLLTYATQGLQVSPDIS